MLSGVEQADVVVSDAASAPARAPWLPIVLASVAVAAAVLWMLLWLLGVALFLWSPDDLMPKGVRVMDSTASEVAWAIAQRVGLPLTAVAVLVMALGGSESCSAMLGDVTRDRRPRCSRLGLNALAVESRRAETDDFATERGST